MRYSTLFVLPLAHLVVAQGGNAIDGSALCRMRLGVLSAVGTVTGCSVTCAVGVMGMQNLLDAPDGTPCQGDGTCSGGRCVVPTTMATRTTTSTAGASSSVDPGLTACKAKYTDAYRVDDFDCFYYCGRRNALGIDGSVDKPDGTNCTKEGTTGFCQSGACEIKTDPGLEACKAKYDDTRSATEYSCFYYCNRSNSLGIDGTVSKPDGGNCTTNGATGTCKSGSCAVSSSTSITSTSKPTSTTSSSSTSAAKPTCSPFQNAKTYCQAQFPRTVSAKRNVCKLQCTLPGGRIGYPNVPNGTCCNNMTGKCQNGQCVPLS